MFIYVFNYLCRTCRSLTTAEKRLLAAAKQGRCADIKTLAANSTNLNCKDTDRVRYAIKLMRNLLRTLYASEQPYIHR